MTPERPDSDSCCVFLAVPALALTLWFLAVAFVQLWEAYFR